MEYIIIKNDFSSLSTARYREALKYYGYGEITKLPFTNSVIYPFPVLKNSRTLSRQASLPRLPVPQLSASMNRYLEAIKPFVNEAEFENTKKITAEFAKEKGVGQKLQEILVQKSKTAENWLSEWWLDKIYLEPRYNLIINTSPGTIYPKENYNTLDGQIDFAAKYITGFIDFKKVLENQDLPVEKLGDSLLCMDQYYKLFGTCRIPNRNKDDLLIMQAYNIDVNKTNHIIVLFNNRIFTLKIVDPKTGAKLSYADLKNNLKSIVQKSINQRGPGLGIMTAENRDVWFDTYNKMINNETNRRNFNKIFNSYFVLCLDYDASKNDTNTCISSAASQMLHGNKTFSSNRWYDKTIQVVVGQNGHWGVSFEHSIAEGVPHALMNDYIYNFIKNKSDQFTDEKSNVILNDTVEELEFKLTKEIESTIQKSHDSVNKLIDNLDVFILDFDKYGKNFPKSQKMSPDAYFQIILQLAFFRVFNKPGNAYESGSLRKFYLGRTDIIRSCSSAAIEFAKSMTPNSMLTPQEQHKLLIKAVNTQRQLTTSAINCESFDRHFLGLKLAALENNIDLPELFNNATFQKLCHYYLSTSQISSKFESVTLFGPAVEDGYGICYNIMEKKILISITSFKSCPLTNSRDFASHISQAFVDCQKLLTSVSPKL